MKPRALPLVRTWGCPTCLFTEKRTTGRSIRRCPNDGTALAYRGQRRELAGEARFAQELIDVRLRLYRETRDPLRVWEALWLALQCQGAGVEMPTPVMDYLGRVARRLLDLSRALDRGETRPVSLATALEWGRGQGTVSAKRAAQRRREQWVTDIIEIMDKGYLQSAAIAEYLRRLMEAGAPVDERSIGKAISAYKSGRFPIGTLTPSPAARQVRPRQSAAGRLRRPKLP